jgi:hypothetical protein
VLWFVIGCGAWCAASVLVGLAAARVFASREPPVGARSLVETREPLSDTTS